MGKPHKHGEMIKAWADGAEIQCFMAGAWMCTNNPQWDGSLMYRIKPERFYPESSLTNNELSQIWNDASSNPSAWRCIANAAVKRHCQDQEKEGK